MQKLGLTLRSYRRSSSLLIALLGACTSAPSDEFTLAQMKDPTFCKDCHPKHYNEWSGSMHAYASEDPVFRAMNARGQQEEPELQSFCVNCHAPMAVFEGATVDGRNLDEVPRHLQGVTCYFCHNAVGLDGSGRMHNNPIQLANDTVMRASIQNAVKPPVHGVAYSRFHDRNQSESSALCGSCHDIVTPKGVHLERTFAEYKDSIFGAPGSPRFETCQGCHMDPVLGVAADAPELRVPSREVHEHLWPGVDVALTPFPLSDTMRVAVEQCVLPNGLLPLTFESAESEGPGVYRIVLEAIAGHNVPSGVSHDRRMWLEITAYDAAGNVMHQSGAIGDDELENTPSAREAWTFHDRTFDEQGKEVHMFWEAAPSAMYPSGKLNASLPPSVPGVAQHWRQQTFALSASGVPPARAVIRVRMRPMGLEILHDLVRTGHLDPSIPGRMPTFTMRSVEVVWDGSGDPRAFEQMETTDKDCRRYACLLQKGATPESCGVPP